MQPSGNYITYCSLIKTIPPETCKLDEQKYTPSLHVTAQTPTTFIYSTSDDRTVPISASVNFYNALIAAGVPAEMHIFRHGEHGSGMGAGSAALDQWPALLGHGCGIRACSRRFPNPSGRNICVRNFDGLKELHRLREAGKHNQLKRLNLHLSNRHQ